MKKIIVLLLLCLTIASSFAKFSSFRKHRAIRYGYLDPDCEALCQTKLDQAPAGTRGVLCGRADYGVSCCITAPGKKTDYCWGNSRYFEECNAYTTIYHCSGVSSPNP